MYMKILKLIYLINMDLKNIEIVPGDAFRIKRDSLVRAGILKYPLTDTPEYCKLLLSQILYWNGKEFIKYQNK